MPILPIAFQLTARSMSDVAKVAEQGALVPLADLGIERLSGSNGIQEVADMRGVRSAVLILADFLAVEIVGSPGTELEFAL